MSDHLNLNHDFSALDVDQTVETHSLYRKIARALSDHPPGQLLEVGCNNGMFLNYMSERGWAVTGIELHEQPASHIVQHDASQPFPFDATFDVVVAAEVIEHIVDTRAFLDHCSRVLRPGGLLVLTTPNLLFIVNRVRMLIGLRPAFCYADYHVRMFVWSDLKEKLQTRFDIDALWGSHILVGLRRHPLVGRIAAALGDVTPRLAAHFIVIARLRDVPMTGVPDSGAVS